MHEKKLIYLLALISIGFGRQSAVQTHSNWITVEGRLTGFKNQVETEDISEYQHLLPPTAERIIIPEPNGHFSIKLKDSTPNYYRLGYYILYLTPGTKLHLVMDDQDLRAVKFAGGDPAAGRYLVAPLSKAGSFLEQRAYC